MPPNLAFVNGQWWTGRQYEKHRAFYSINGLLSFEEPRHLDGTIDLHDAFVIPPLAEGHNHWLEPAKFDDYKSAYLADGVFYVRDMGNVPILVNQFAERTNQPSSIDFESAMIPFTGPGAHPVEIIDQFVQFGVLPSSWKPDYDKQGQYVVTTEREIDERFALLLEHNPAYVKAFLLYSDRYEESLKDPKTRGN